MPPFKLQQPRQFEFRPRYYDPQAEENDGKTRVKFRHIRRETTVPRSNPVRLLIIVLILLFAIIYLNKKANLRPDPQSDKIIVEEVIVVD
jgi:hypothetical protein